MSAELRSLIQELEKRGILFHVKKPVSTRFEAAALMKKLAPRPIIFYNIKESPGFRMVANLCADRGILAEALGIGEDEIHKKLLEAMENPRRLEITEKPSCQEVVIKKPDLTKLPFLWFGGRDRAPYLTAGIIIAHDKEYGFNASYHRLMLLDERRVVARILPRHLHLYIERGNNEIAITIGNHPAFMLASATSWKLGVSELAIASALKPIKYTKTLTNDLLVPASSEIILEGCVTDERADEGPFIDVTGTYDIIRKERVIEIRCITMRKNPIFQAILPGEAEHKNLMGLPREATIYKEVSKVCECLDVRLTPGGSSWLHAAIKIRKRKEDDGRRAIEAAFKGHESLKHVIVVDEDIDISKPEEIEWAIATRVQLDKDLILKPGELGSSLDPSADQITRKTCKAGIDATIPKTRDPEKFRKVKIPYEDEIKLEEYLEDYLGNRK